VPMKWTAPSGRVDRIKWTTLSGHVARTKWTPLAPLHSPARPQWSLLTVHARPFVGSSQRRSWSHLVVLGAILWAVIAEK